MTSKEMIEEISWIRPSSPHHQEMCEQIKQDLERLEKLEKENQELRKAIKQWNINGGNLLKENAELKNELEKLKERYKHRAETSNDLCKAVKQYEKVIDILEKFVSLTKVRNEETNKWDIPIIYSLGLHRKLTQEEYELLKEVL